MDTSGRAILLAGATVVIALLGMFATGVAFMYGLAIAAVLAVLAVLAASLTLLPALLSRLRSTARPSPGGPRSSVRTPPGRGEPARRTAPSLRTAPPRSAWRRWSEIVQARPWPLAIVSLALMILLLVPVFTMRLDSSDAGNDPASTSSRHAFDLLAQGFGAGFNGPLLLVAELHARQSRGALSVACRGQRHTRCRRRHRSHGSRRRVRSPSSRPIRTRRRRRSPRRTSSTTSATPCCRRSRVTPG